MAVNTSYTFSYDGYPRVHQVTSIDGEEINNVIIDFTQQYDSIPTQSIEDFSIFLLEQFNIIMGSIIDNNLSLEKYNQSVEPLRNICRIKTDCDEIIYNRQNPPQNENPWPPLD